MKSLLLVLFSFIVSSLFCQINLKSLKTAADKAQEVIVPSKLSAEEIVKGLKEALIIGTVNTSKNASKQGGFNKNDLIRISFPPETQNMKNNLIKVGMQSQVISFESTLNKAAEDASQFAKQIFIDAIKSMKINDAMSILKGSNNAATIYLMDQTTNTLYAKFRPIVKKSIAKVKLEKSWNVLANRHNSLPFTKKITPDLVDYITIQTIEGLFVLISKEEKNIRNNPKARVSDVLKKVFK